MEELLKNIVQTQDLIIKSIKGLRRPPLEEKINYRCTIVPQSFISKLIIKFGLIQNPSEYFYEITNYSPKEDAKKIGAAILRIPTTQSGIDIDLYNSSLEISERYNTIIWVIKNLEQKNYNVNIEVCFNNQAPKPLKPCSGQEFEIFLELEYYTRSIFRKTNIIIPAASLKSSISSIIPTLKIKNSHSIINPTIITNEFGFVFLGDIRQVSMRAESICYFIEQIMLSDADNFKNRILSATKKIAKTWLQDVIRTNAIDEINLESWVNYDSLAGLGKINITKGENPDNYKIIITEPFTSFWSLPKETHKIFWECYVTGMVETITARKIKKLQIKGEVNYWNIEFYLN